MFFKDPGAGIFHAALMPYFPGIGFDAFHRKMEDNELKASVCSEIRVYFELPQLRDIAFPHQIYADRFLSDPAMQTLWRCNKPVAIETLQEARRDVMFSKPEYEMDLAERWIRRFATMRCPFSTSRIQRSQSTARGSSVHCPPASSQTSRRTSALEKTGFDSSRSASVSSSGNGIDSE